MPNLKEKKTFSAYPFYIIIFSMGCLLDLFLFHHMAMLLTEVARIVFIYKQNKKLLSLSFQIIEVLIPFQAKFLNDPKPKVYHNKYTFSHSNI